MLSPFGWAAQSSGLATLVAPVLAHPGHGTVPADSVLHYAVEPIHAWWGVLLLAVVAVSVAYYRHRASQKMLQHARVDQKSRNA